MKDKLYKRFHFALSLMCILGIIVKLIFEIDSFYLSVYYAIISSLVAIFNFILFMKSKTTKDDIFYLSVSLSHFVLIMFILNTIIY